MLARSDQTLVLSADALVPGRLRATRVHGGASLAAAVQFQTEALPGSNSLAWVEPWGQLTIGTLDSSPTIRWSEVGLGASPTLLAYLRGSSCAAVVCSDTSSRSSSTSGRETGGGSSSLRLVDVSSPVGAAQVGWVPLTPGHAISAMGVVRLRCSGSAVSSSGAGAEVPAVKEFLLVASCIDGAQAPEEAPAEPVASSASPTPGSDLLPWWRQQAAFFTAREQCEQQEGGGGGGGTQQSRPGQSSPAAPGAAGGLLSFFEVQHEPSDPAAAAGGSSGSSSSAGVSSQPRKLLLHGTVPLPAACFSIAGVVPMLGEPLEQPDQGQLRVESAAGRAQEAGQAPPAQELQDPLLLLGCYDGLRLYRCFVDDAGTEAQRLVERGLGSIAVVDPLEFGEGVQCAPGGEGTSIPVAAAAAASRGLEPGQSAGVQQQEAGAPPAAARLWHQRVALQLLAKVRGFGHPYT